jgi:fatty-acyl-CoA synthase
MGAGQFATARAGLVLVNINPAYRSHELEYALSMVDCRALILARNFKTSDYPAILRELAPELGAPGLAGRVCRRCATSSCWAKAGTCPAAGVSCAGRLRRRRRAGARGGLAGHVDAGRCDQHPVHLRHHGSPKGATLTHRNILNNGRFIGDCMRLGEPTGCASRCRSTIASAWCWATWPA